MNNSSFEQYTTDYISGVMSLRKPQEKSLKILENIINKTNLIHDRDSNKALEIIHNEYPILTDFEREFISFTFALATGVGKTRLMGAFITYLYTNWGIKDFLVVAPNTTIYEKLKADLGDPNNPKYVFKGIGCFNNVPKVIADDDYRNRNISLFDSDVNIYVYNIGKFDREDTRMRAFNENLGMSFFDKLAEMKNLVMIMDESHHYRADRGMTSLNELKPILGLELTATPKVNIGNSQEYFKNVVYYYPLSEAIADGYTRTPYAMTRADIQDFNFGEEQIDKLMINDGINFHQYMKCKLKDYARINHKQLVKPFMLVVCQDTTHAKKVEEYIKSNDFCNGYYKNKTIRLESRMSAAQMEINTKLLLEVEKNENPIEVVIHVNMLKEGWDVNNLYTIVPLRASTSDILKDQMVGRGLRLPYGERTGDKDIDCVMLTAHHKFEKLISEAQRGDSIFNEKNILKIEEIENQKSTVTQIALNLDTENDELAVKINTGDDIKNQEVSRQVNRIITDKITNNLYENKEIEKSTKEEIITEINENKDLSDIYNANKTPIDQYIELQIKKVPEQVKQKFIMIPKIKTEREEGEYYFKKFKLDFSTFNQAPIDNKILLQSLIDASETKYIKADSINFDAVNPSKVLVEKLREKSEIDYERDAELLHELIESLLSFYETKYDDNEVKNIVMMNKNNITTEIYRQMMNNFVRDEGIINESVYTDNPMNLQAGYTYSIIKDLFDNYESNRDGKITSVLFDGIKKGVFDIAKFDSEPELKFARIIERDEKVQKWLRPAPKEFNITYNGGKEYEPDFVVEAEDVIYLVEVKGDDRLNDPDVIAKKKKSIEYCKLVSKWAEETNNKKWIHLFIPASVIQSNSTFDYLTDNYKAE